MRRTALFAGTAICAVLMATPAFAQNTDTDSQASAPQAEEPRPADQIVVTGFRRAYADALNIKRESDQITDSISSDGLGRFPDLNVGEAIQRIPGVQINREADSRNATISLRGLPGSFARTTLNGGDSPIRSWEARPTRRPRRSARSIRTSSRRSR